MTEDEFFSADHPDLTPMERYRDFRAVFLTTDQGRRVLHEIMRWGHMFNQSYHPVGQVDPYRVMGNEGERSLALKIYGTAMVEPPELPTQANRKRMSNG